MRLESITVHGLLAVTGTTALDLREIPPGLIAIVGRNGHGKTTLLDAGPASIHRRFPSRGGKALVDFAHLRDSYLDATWAFDGRGVIRLRVNVDGEKRLTDAAIERLQPDGTRVPLNDGKVSTFDAVVAEWFPPRDVLLASAVAAQNKEGSFSRLDRPKRQELFACLLGLDRYQAMAETAKRAAALFAEARAGLVGRLEILSRHADPAALPALDQETCERDAEQHAVMIERGRLIARRADLTAAQSTLRERATAHAEALSRATGLQVALREVQASLDRVPAEQARLRREAQADEARTQDAAAKRVADVAERLDNNRRLFADAEAIRADALAHAAGDMACQRLRAEIADLGTAIHELDAEIVRATQARHAAEQAAAALRAAQDDARGLVDVPCGGAHPYGACHFLARAIASRDQIPARLEAVERHFSVADVVATLSRLATERQTATDARAAAEVQLGVAVATVSRLATRAALVPKVEAAEQRIVELETERQQVEAERHERVGAIRARVAEAIAQTEATRVDLEARRAVIAADLAAVDRLVADTAGAAAEEATCAGALEALSRAWDALTHHTAQIEAALTDLATRRAAILAAQAEWTEVDGRRRAVEDHLLDYQFLAKALGKDGLPTLEIDAAGPTVSSLCNDLLAACFGSRFSVELVTQAAKEKGGFKEVFELKVYDNERGGEPRDLDDLSGGEQIIVDEALKNAIAAFVNQRNVAPVQTMFRDETTGPLDGENAGMYLAMLRRFRERAGVHHLLFVTHNRDAALAADAQIVVERGVARVVLPPYAEVA